MHEARFIKEVGVDQESGLTIGKIPLNKRTGMPKQENTNKRSSMKNEALHIAILANALAGHQNASLVYSKNEALDILSKKL